MNIADVELHSAWRIGQRLVVISKVMDGWVTIQYIDDNNGMKRTADIDIPQLLEHYSLFYKPSGDL
jgi:hypothetical protein